MQAHKLKAHLSCALFAAGLAFIAGAPSAHALTVAQGPLWSTGALSPMVMLVMSNDHTLFYQAYNDASDLNGDGVLNVGYEPDKVDYYGYFDSDLCYTYSTADSRFEATANAIGKKCRGSGWSGDFLNYVTTSRMDALRKVLYGGTRSTDTETETVLERSFIPQDAHSWGKEYFSIEHDGYDIRDYTPLPLPAPGTRHLLANTTLLERDYGNNFTGRDPRMRILLNSRFRVWNWVAKERPVAGGTCDDNGNHNASCTYNAGTVTAAHPNNAAQYEALFTTWANAANLCGSAQVSNIAINGSYVNTSARSSANDNNPFTAPAHCNHDNYLTRIEGRIYAPVNGDYTFATNGDDAVEFLVNGQVVSHWYGGHGRHASSTQTTATAYQTIANDINNQATGHNGTIRLAQGWHDFEFRHQEGTGGDSWQLLWTYPGQGWEPVPTNRTVGPGGTGRPQITTWSTRREFPASTISEYIVRVKVCNPPYLESNCTRYSTGYKPTGLLHEYTRDPGEADAMLFGLISGSSTHPYNMRGGQLRKNIESFSNEFDHLTGQFTNYAGIVRTIDRFRIVDFNVGTNYAYQGGWLTTASMANSNSQFPDWGNPIGEMMYESLRYFSGRAAPTPQFVPTLTTDADGRTWERVRLRDISNETFNFLPAPAWEDPFVREGNRKPYCTPMAQLVISDVNPSFDTQFVPGSPWSTFTGDIPGLNAATHADAIWNAEYGGSRDIYIGEVRSGGTSNYDSAPSVKTASGLSGLRGLAPSEPTRQGGYLSAGLARYGYVSDIRPEMEEGRQFVHTFSVALAAPLPKIELPTPTGLVTLVPFAKSTGGSGISATRGNFQPTNTIVDFFTETFANTDPNGSDADPDVNEGRPYIVFRINYEDVEQGADHDMDAIVRYEIGLNAEGNVDINLVMEYQAGGIIHSMGYVISGTTADGVYLEVADEVVNPPYFLNTPAGRLPGWCNQNPVPEECGNMPLLASRTFTPSTSSEAATLLQSPLWYAAKYGSAGNENLQPGETSENYFLVTNASTLAEQLALALDRIMALVSTTGISVSATRLTTDSLAFSAEFDSDGWTGELRGMSLDPETGTDTEIWKASEQMRRWDTRNLWTRDPDSNQAVRFDDTLPLSVKDRIGSVTVGSPGITYGPDELIEYVLGSGEYEGLPSDNRLRTRRGRPSPDRAPLSDIVNSVPAFSGRGNEGWVRLPASEGGASYGGENGFITYRRDLMRSIVMVGSNGGMVHAFDASNGDELFGYVPMVVQDNLNELARPNWPHRYFADGQIAIADAHIGASVEPRGRWKRIAVGTTGAGGRSVFAMDVTSPLEMNAEKFLWEFTDVDLGYTIGQPLITRLRENPDDSTSRWVAIFGNGYASPNHQAYLYVVDLYTGELLNKVRLGQGGTAEHPNGLSSPALWMDPRTRTAAWRVYAGDLHGNMWRVDFVQSEGDSEGARSPGTIPSLPFGEDTPLFTDPNGRRITSAPTVAGHPTAGLMIFFGTGSFFAVGDNALSDDPPIEHFYAIRDYRPYPLPEAPNFARYAQAPTGPLGIVEVQAPDPDMEDDDGWYLELARYERGGQGERVLVRPNVRFGRLLFTTFEPTGDPCEGGGLNRLYNFAAVRPNVLGVNDPPPVNGGGESGQLDGPAIELPSGAPTVAPLVILPPQGDSIPGFDRPEAQWCRTLSTLVPNPDNPGQLIRELIGILCDGRQTWRQDL